ncbi:MAG: M48 family metallopeptidase [Flavobacteriales bacterium]|nr:M48 family metallopeptidase [Flavobacteriales bacterium]
MKKLLFITLIAVAILVACAKVPITGRKQMNLVSESTIMGMADTQYQEVLQASRLVPDSDPRTRQVKSVGDKIAAAATKYLKDNKQGKRVEGFQWAFNLIDEPTVNAWCMPGGKVAFYTGILPITANEPGLAVVMGHEVAHAIARHGNERMSQAIALQGAGMTVEVLTSQKPGLARDIFLQSMGVGGQLGMLAYSRTHETEADKMGLIFMAMAGYDPREAPKFWERMSAGSGGGAPPELLSTHPSDATRIRDLEAFMPEALKYYKP